MGSTNEPPPLDGLWSICMRFYCFTLAEHLQHCYHATKDFLSNRRCKPCYPISFACGVIAAFAGLPSIVDKVLQHTTELSRWLIQETQGITTCQWIQHLF